MKDFGEGQEVFLLRKEFLFDIKKVVIVKKYQKTKRWRVGIIFNEFGKEIKRLRMSDDNEVFFSFNDAYIEAMCYFDRKIKSIEENRERFKLEVQGLKSKEDKNAPKKVRKR